MKLFSLHILACLEAEVRVQDQRRYSATGAKLRASLKGHTVTSWTKPFTLKFLGNLD